VHSPSFTDLDTAPAGQAASADALDSPARRRCFHLVLISVLVGTILRVVQYLHHNSYWNDEAALVLNILRRDVRNLLEALDFAQAAPPLFLWAERLLYLRFGSSEYVLRALPVLLGLASLPLFAMLAWRLLRPTGAAWAVAWFAVNDRIIPQVCEVKQYSNDLFFSTLLLFAAFAPGPAAPALRRLARAAIVASVAFWFSFPSVIVFGGITLALLPQIVRQSRGLLRMTACTIPPLISGALLAKLVLSNPRDHYLNEFWAPYFVNFAHPARWFARAIFELGDYPFASLGVVVLVLAVLGMFVLRGQGRQTFVGAALATLLLALVASGLRVYPFGGSRVTLYLLPPLFLLAGAGTQAWRDRGNAWLRGVWWVLPASLVALAAGNCALHAIWPGARSNIRPVVQYVSEHRQSDEMIYLAGGGVLPQTRVSGRNVEFLCYWQGGEENIVRQMIPPEEITARRFWVVYSLISSEKLSRLDPLLRRLDAVADVRERFVAGPAGAVLYVRREVAATQPAAAAALR
jgi:hypothetical protein